ncbi:diguanylate cyclase domain-containing protein [Nocardia africana]|uniref:Diguanylate cyclase n=1 Tax=Nocardia africana TaxID=134964 RepID=A0A378WY55_9NOCA|nr:diguanylate cyclase [Nocardia africana]MCC3312982.1 GGDEF domain-containing protein [Nocardia africana]SUA45677.1 diguanylate cyclase [Nocardia africana]
MGTPARIPAWRSLSLPADRQLSALAASVTVGEHQLHVSASIGGVVTAVAGSPAEDLLDAADRALYQAKTSGRHHWIIHTLDSPTQQ